MKETSEEMEDMMAKHDSLNLHKKIKEMSGIFKKQVPSLLTDNNNKIIIDEDEIKKEWEKYISELFADDRGGCTELQAYCLDGPEILQSEVEHAIQTTKNRKAVGPDEIPVEMMKLVDEDNIEVLVKLFDAVWDTGKIPSDWLRSTFVAIPEN